MADEDLDLDGGDEEEEAPKSSKKMLIIIIVGVVLLVTLGVLGGMFMGGAFDDNTETTETEEVVDGEGSGEETKSEGEEDADATEGDESQLETSYWPLDPPFVLNFEGKSKARYMQIGLEVATTSDKVQAAVKKHMPMLRNEIVLLLSGQKYEELSTPEGKEQLRAELIETINTNLKRHKVKKGISNIYFTSFVMQ